MAPILELLSGQLDAQAAIARLQLDTRRYAKRQYTWFRNQSPHNWLHATDSNDAACHLATLLF
jgi:tRNA dimethylallyltransferase